MESGTGGGLPDGPALLLQRDNLDVLHNSVSMLYQASQRVGGFVEWFELTTFKAGSGNNSLHYFDTGLFYYLTTNVQLDARFGTRRNADGHEIFTGAGFSVRY